MDDYDKTYRQTSAVFGDKPEKMLLRYAVRLKAEGRVLDVGCGQGRNSIWLAEQGFHTVALDPSEVALETLHESAARRDLAIETCCGGFLDLPKSDEPFDGICVFGLLQILDRPSIGLLIAALRRWSGSGSLVFLSAWSVSDPQYEVVKRSWRKIGAGSFADQDGRIRTFLEPGEILELFADWNSLHHWQGLGPWHRHGGGPEERHGRVELVAQWS